MKIPKNYEPNAQALEPLLDTEAEEKRLTSITKEKELRNTEMKRQREVRKLYAKELVGGF